jgi:hypothetical protein
MMEEKLIEHVIAARAELGVKTNAELLILLESDFKGLTMSEVKKAASKATKRTGGACVPAAAEPSPAEKAPSKRQEKAQEKAKAAALPEHAAASPGLAIISGRAPYFQKAWWFDEAVPKRQERWHDSRLPLCETHLPWGFPRSRLPKSRSSSTCLSFSIEVATIARISPRPPHSCATPCVSVSAA